MEMLRQRVPLWSPSADSLSGRISRATDGAVRVLTSEDTAALQRLIDADPVANVSVATTLAGRTTAGPGRGRNGAVFLGIDAAPEAPSAPTAAGAPAAPGAPSGGAAPSSSGAVAAEDEPSADGSAAGELAAACWVGSNINPVGAEVEQARMFGRAIGTMRRRTSSIYGPAEAVLELFDSVGRRTPREVRPDQPMLTMTTTSAVEPLPGVRVSRPEDFTQLEPACAAMFTEELGFSPYLQGVSQYRERIRNLIGAEHSLVCTRPGGSEILFKAEFGAVTEDVVQIQGVWVHPDHRGRGLAVPGMAAVVNHALTLAPTVSLYVNSYNIAALRAYRRVGFERVGTFATVLF